MFNSLIQPAPARYYFLAAAAAIWLGVVIVIAWKDHAARKGPFWAFIILLTGVAWLAPTRPRPLGLAGVVCASTAASLLLWRRRQRRLRRGGSAAPSREG